MGRRGAEVFKGELTGSGGCTDRKQSLSLSSYRSWVKPRGGDQRSAPCVQLTDTSRSIPFAGCATLRSPGAGSSFFAIGVAQFKLASGLAARLKMRRNAAEGSAPIDALAGSGSTVSDR